MTKHKNERTNIDEEINRAISTISELEEFIKRMSDEKGMIAIHGQSPIRDKFNQLHKEVQLLTQALMELGLLDEEDLT